jgi:hypothetical protein
MKRVTHAFFSFPTTETYHMIDTCDPTVACWSDDGETFIVKDPVKFEKQIIPQFFKHSKFSSFVRVSSGFVEVPMGNDPHTNQSCLLRSCLFSL